MRLPVELRHVAPRLATGAFIPSSGLARRGADELDRRDRARAGEEHLSLLGKPESQEFIRLLSAGGIALGAALLLPVVPTALAGVGVTAFSAGLMGLYLRTPGMREEGSLRPTREGTALAKDTWMLGIGIGFVVDGIQRR